MAIRVTQNQTSLGFTNDLQSIYAKLAKSQQQVGDGRAITRPSDDPFGTGQTIDFDAQLKDVKQYQTNVNNASDYLSDADGSLETATVALQKIYTLGLQAQNNVNGTADLASIAAEMTQLKEVVRSAFNAQHGDTFIFGGTSTGTAPFPTPGNAYVGNLNPLQSRVAANQTVQLSANGEAIAGVSPANVFDDIDALITAVQGNNSAGMQAANSAIMVDTDRVISERTNLGATAARLEATLERLEAQEERIMDARSRVADVDSTEAFMNLSKQQTMYQAALASGTKIMQTTILNYI